MLTEFSRMDLDKNWMKCGFPFNAIENVSEFLLKYTRCCPDQSHLKRIIPVIQAAEMQDIKLSAGSKPFSICFDGTTCICEVLGVHNNEQFLSFLAYRGD